MTSGPADQTYCFTHVLNLIVKSIIKQFDLPKVQANKVLGDVAEELLKLARDIECEEESFAEDGDVLELIGWKSTYVSKGINSDWGEQQERKLNIL